MGTAAAIVIHSYVGFCRMPVLTVTMEPLEIILHPDPIELSSRSKEVADEIWFSYQSICLLSRPCDQIWDH